MVKLIKPKVNKIPDIKLISLGIKIHIIRGKNPNTMFGKRLKNMNLFFVMDVVDVTRANLCLIEYHISTSASFGKNIACKYSCGNILKGIKIIPKIFSTSLTPKNPFIFILRKITISKNITTGIKNLLVSLANSSAYSGSSNLTAFSGNSPIGRSSTPLNFPFQINFKNLATNLIKSLNNIVI